MRDVKGDVDRYNVNKLFEEFSPSQQNQQTQQNQNQNILPPPPRPQLQFNVPQQNQRRLLWSSRNKKCGFFIGYTDDGFLRLWQVGVHAKCVKEYFLGKNYRIITFENNVLQTIDENGESKNVNLKHFFE